VPSPLKSPVPMTDQPEFAKGRDALRSRSSLSFPDARPERMPYFIDGVHISDKGNDVLGRFYAERILLRDASTSPGSRGGGAAR